MASSGEDAPDVASGDAREPGAAGSSGDGSEQETDTAWDTSLSQDGVRTLGTIPPSECGAGEVARVPWVSPGSESLSQSSAAKGKGWGGSGPCAETQPLSPDVGVVTSV